VQSQEPAPTSVPTQTVDATYTSASETELRRRLLEGDRYAKAEMVRRSKASEPLSPEQEELVERLREEFDAVEVAA
jgi:hypothetical protein